MLKDFDLAFGHNFEKFVTEEDPNDRWTYELDDVTKKHIIKLEKRWHWFLGEKACVMFKCLVSNQINYKTLYSTCIFRIF